MRTSLVLLVSIVASATTAPVRDTSGARLFSSDKDAAPLSTETSATDRPTKKQSEQLDGGTRDSILALSQDDAPSQKQSNEAKDSRKKSRKHKAIFVDYLPQSRFANVPPYNNLDTEEKSPKDYQESNIFYIRLPPIPYMFVPGLGYVSRTPNYSMNSLRPQTKPARPKPTYQQTVKPFIKVPVDFVSNGKPSSVYQLSKKPAKKPADSPITILDSLSTEFVSNGKPTSIYQWQSNVKPNRRPEESVNNLDKGPYKFNGKPSSFFLLRSDGTSSARQPLRYPGYQEDNSYY